MTYTTQQAGRRQMSRRPAGLPVIAMLRALVIAVLLAYVFRDGLVYTVAQWEREEFSYGYVVPFMAVLLAWRAITTLPTASSGGYAWGVALVGFGALITVPAQVGGLPAFIYYGFVISLAGLALAVYGWIGLRQLAAPIVYLFFALPLPNTLYITVSTTMQMVSSVLGTEALRSMGYSVFLEGNVIDLGLYQLQVAEACNGLNYLFPLASFAFLVGYLYKGPFWHKVVLFVATVPITIGINSLRIALTGVLVNRNGIEAAEGFMHLFEGWVIFICGLILMFVTLQVMMIVTGRRQSILSALDLEVLFPRKGEPAASGPGSSPATILVALVLAGCAALYMVLPEPARALPDRKPLATFPLSVDGWQGRDEAIAQNYLDILKLDDYLLADFRHEGAAAGVNLYIAWYATQDRRASIHSPEVCIPAGGWEITRFNTTTVDAGNGYVLPVNRVLIVNGTDRQLVYYWFRLRHRDMTSELMIKAANVVDALTIGRTDGALLRLVTPVQPGEDVKMANQRLANFVRDVNPILDDYIPR